MTQRRTLFTERHGNVTFQDVLEFWFSSAQKSRWYAKDEKFDADIRHQRFLATYEAAYAVELDEWRSTPESLLALIILLDQFPRNMFRGSPRDAPASQDYCPIWPLPAPKRDTRT